MAISRICGTRGGRGARGAFAAALALVAACAGGVRGLAAQAGAEIPTYDLSDEAAATAVGSEYAGGFLAGVRNILVNDLGIWVADRENNEVLWFDLDGTLKAGFGREGEGPGEFNGVSLVRVDSLLVVDDDRGGRQVSFRLDGSHKETTRSRRFPRSGGRSRVLRGATPLRGGFTVGVIEGVFGSHLSRSTADDFSHKVLLLRPTGESVDTLFSYHWGLVAWQANRVRSVWAAPPGESGAWAALGDSAVALADGGAGTLTFVFPEADTVRTRTVDLGLEARPVTDGDLAEFKAAIKERYDDIREEIEIDAPAAWSVAAGMIVKGDRMFWLRQGARADASRGEEWIVFDLATSEKRRVLLPERFQLQAVHGGLLYGLVLDELDLPSVRALPNPVEGAAGPGGG